MNAVGAAAFAAAPAGSTWVEADAIILPVAGDGRRAVLNALAREADQRLGGSLSEALDRMRFLGRVGEAAALPTFGLLPAPLLIITGIGPDESRNAEVWKTAAGAAAAQCADAASVTVALEQEALRPPALAAVVHGLAAGAYRPRGDRPRRPTFALPAALPDELAQARIVAEAACIARDLVNASPAELTPAKLAEAANALMGDGDVDVTVTQGHALGELGMPGTIAVGRGSHDPPCLIQLRLGDPSPAPLALVGKGITFDAGGLNIKSQMAAMKSDMAGAAAVMATVWALAELGCERHVLALLPAAENMPGGRALRPGEIIRHRGGRTTEIVDTDSEGRLVLADALELAGAAAPAAIVDVATLTGLMRTALGPLAGGLFSDHDGLAAELTAAADRAGDRLWRMPLYPEYLEYLKSDVADLRNEASQPAGNSIVAALFLRQFVADGVPWAHLDICPSAFHSEPRFGTPGATAMPTASLIEWVQTTTLM